VRPRAAAAVKHDPAAPCTSGRPIEDFDSQVRPRLIPRERGRNGPLQHDVLMAHVIPSRGGRDTAIRPLPSPQRTV